MVFRMFSHILSHRLCLPLLPRKRQGSQLLNSLLYRYKISKGVSLSLEREIKGPRKVLSQHTGLVVYPQLVPAVCQRPPHFSSLASWPSRESSPSSLSLVLLCVVVVVYLVWFFVLFSETVLCDSSGCPGIHSVAQAGLKLQRSAYLCL